MYVCLKSYLIALWLERISQEQAAPQQGVLFLLCSAQAFIPRRLISLSDAYSNARILTPQHQPWILNACLDSHPPGRNAWFRASPGQFPGHSLLPHFAREFPNRPEESLSGSPPKALTALNIDPPKSPNPQNPEGGHPHPSSGGSSDGWVTGSLGQVSSSGAFLTNMYGSGSSDSMQSLSPGKNSPPLDEQRAYSHQEAEQRAFSHQEAEHRAFSHQEAEQRAFSHQEARVEQMYRAMAPRFDENGPGDGVNTQQPHSQAMAPFSNGLSASLASLKVAGNNLGRPDDVFGFSRGFGQEGLRVSEGLRMSEGLRIPEGLRAPDGLGGSDMWPSKQEEAVQFGMAYDLERLSDLERDGVHTSEVRCSSADTEKKEGKKKEKERGILLHHLRSISSVPILLFCKGRGFVSKIGEVPKCRFRLISGLQTVCCCLSFFEQKNPFCAFCPSQNITSSVVLI
jgi:hypothetical protein